MAQYIDKDALVAKIEKRFDEYSSSILRHYDACTEARASELGKILVLLNTFEVKDVNLDFQTFAKEMDAVFALPSSKTKNTEEEPLNGEYAIAKHFFELGIAVSNKQIKEKDI